MIFPLRRKRPTENVILVHTYLQGADSRLDYIGLQYSARQWSVIQRLSLPSSL